MARRFPNIEARARFRVRMVLGGKLFRPLRLFCDHCDKYVPSDMVWECAHCDYVNAFTNIFSFLNRCSRCKRVPRAYCCPHCDRVNFLDGARGGDYAAKQYVQPGAKEPEVAPPDPREIRSQNHEDEKTEMLRKIEIGLLKRKLTQIEASFEFQKERTHQEKLRERFDKKLDKHLAFDMLKKQLASEYAEALKDAEFKERMDLVLNELAAEEGLMMPN